MTDEEKFESLKMLLDGVDDLSSDLLNEYLEQSQNIILNKCYPYIDDFSEVTMPPKYDRLQVQIACELALKRGAEGETSHKDGDVTRSYESAGVSQSLLDRIVPYVKKIGSD